MKAGTLSAETAERIRHPRTRARKTGQQKSRGLQIRRRPVEVRFRLHRHQERHVVHVPGQMRQRAAHPASALLVLRPFKQAPHDRARRADARLDALARARIERLPVPRDELRLVVEEIALACAAIHEELDDALGPRGKMWCRAAQPLAPEQRGQRDPAEAVRERAQEVAARLEGSEVHGAERVYSGVRSTTQSCPSFGGSQRHSPCASPAMGKGAARSPVTGSKRVS